MSKVVKVICMSSFKQLRFIIASLHSGALTKECINSIVGGD